MNKLNEKEMEKKNSMSLSLSWAIWKKWKNNQRIFLNIKENTKHSAIKKQFFANFAFSIFSPKSSKL